MMIQQIEQRSGEKPIAIIKRANYVNGKLRKSVKVYNGNRWVNAHAVNLMRTNVGARPQKTKKTRKVKKAKKAKKTKKTKKIRI